MSFTEKDYQEILGKFAALSDPKYKAFNESLIPGTQTAYGVRTPYIRDMAKTVVREGPRGFLSLSRSGSFEEIMLRGMVIASMKAELSERLALIEGFLPLVNNWAVCDAFCSSFRLKKPEERAGMWDFLTPLFQSPQEFTARFAAVMFLDHFVTEDYIDRGLELLEAMPQEAYYARMATAWAISVCFIKFPERTLPLLQKRSLSQFTQNKSIQKIRESYRVSREDKDMLLQYKL